MKKIVKDLAADFKRWGKEPTRLVQAGIKRWGVIFNYYEHNGKG